MISSKNYTFYIASTPGKMRKLTVPAYVLHGVAALAIIGSITVLVAVGSYSRMLLKVGNYNAVRQERDVWKKQVRELQSTVKDTNQRLDAVQSLATDVAMTFGVMKYHPAAFETTDAPSSPEDIFDRSVEQFTFLKRNAAAIAVSAEAPLRSPESARAIARSTCPWADCGMSRITRLRRATALAYSPSRPLTFASRVKTTESDGASFSARSRTNSASASFPASSSFRP